MTLYTIEHSTDGYLIDPGQLVTMLARPQRVALLPRSVEIEAARGIDFAIRAAMIGGRLVLRLGIVGIPARGGMAMDETELAQWFTFAEPILVGMDFRLDVQNVGRGSASFVARWTCEEVIVHERDGERTIVGTETAKIDPRLAFRPERVFVSAGTSRPDITKRPPNVPFRPTSLKRMGDGPPVAGDIKIGNLVPREAIGTAESADWIVRDVRWNRARASNLDRVPGRTGKPERWERTPPGFGWDPGED